MFPECTGVSETCSGATRESPQRKSTDGALKVGLRGGSVRDGHPAQRRKHRFLVIIVSSN